MKTIWKFPFETGDVIKIKMPEHAKIIHVETQNKNTPCMWAIVNPEEEQTERTFRVYGTGHPMDENVNQEYMGTYLLYGGSLVFHVFWWINK